MPTPIGHSLAGYAAAKLTRVQLGDDERRLFLAAAFFGVLPDALGFVTDDLLAGAQHGFSHSLAGMIVVSLLAAGIWSRGGRRFWPVLLFVAAAYGSHLVADLLRPILDATSGEQLFWPLPGRYGIELNILPHVPTWTRPVAVWWRELAAIVAREILLLAPIAFACRFLRPVVPTRPAEQTVEAEADRAAA